MSMIAGVLPGGGRRKASRRVESRHMEPGGRKQSGGTGIATAQQEGRLELPDTHPFIGVKSLQVDPSELINITSLHTPIHRFRIMWSNCFRDVRRFARQVMPTDRPDTPLFCSRWPMPTK